MAYTGLNGYGEFGRSSKYYASSRRPFPTEILDFLSRRRSEQALMLDLGCGTGISTRQLAQRARLCVGCDVDPSMITQALRGYSENVAYAVAAAEALPFQNSTFDLVACFSSFHWFDHTKSTKEIIRVLKPSGTVGIVNKNDSGALKSDFRHFIQQFVKMPLPNIKSAYDPKAILQSAEFDNIDSYSIRVQERFSFAEAMAYLQSVSLWNLVPNEVKAQAYSELEKFCVNHMSGGVLVRDTIVRAIIGSVPE